MTTDQDYRVTLVNDLMEHQSKLGEAVDVKDAVVHSGHAQIDLLYAIYLETQHNAQLHRVMGGIERSMNEIVQELRGIRESLDAQRTQRPEAPR